MTAPDWLTSTRVAVVAGKGGVGSSTVAAAYALAAAREGADVLFVAVDGRPGMGPLLGGRELDSSDRILRRIKGAGQVRGRTIPADQAFGETESQGKILEISWRDHHHDTRQSGSATGPHRQFL